MKNQIEQQEHYTPEVEAKIKRYSRIGNGLTALGVAGSISAISAIVLLAPSNYERPEIAKSYQNAQTTLQTLQSTRKNLRDKVLDLPYQTIEIREFEEIFNRNSNKTISKLDKAIESVEIKIPEIETNPALIQHQQNIRTNTKKYFGFYFGGVLAMIIGGVGRIVPKAKKKNLERKYRKQNEKSN